MSNKHNEKNKDLIFGKNDTEKILNISYSDGVIDTYYLDSNDQVQCRSQEYTPYVVTSNKFKKHMKLSGDGYYKYLTPVVNQDYEMLYGPNIYKPRTIEEGFMLTSGNTYFKNMRLEELAVLSFDIEATGLDPRADDAQVVLIANTFRDRSGGLHKKLFKLLDYDNELDPETAMIADWEKWVKKQDPDLMLCHNVFGYDIPYLFARNAGSLDLGRMPGNIKFTQKPRKFRKDGQQQYDYYDARIAGREIIDTMFLSIKYDLARQFPSYGLKSIEKHLGLTADDRSWDFDKYPVVEVLNKARQGDTELWEQFCDYARDDSDSLINVFDIMAPSLFYLNQSIPKTFQQIINEATGSQIDSFMIRGYLQNRLALPKASPKAEFEGAISMGIPGIYKHVRKVDVASLYPSIMRQYKIYPKEKDYKGYFLKSLDYFTEERLKNKKIAEETGDSYYDGLQAAQKIVINSMYGFMGANYLLFNHPSGAADVTRHGRDVLLKGVEWATGHTLEHVVKHIKNKGKDNEEVQYEWVLGEKVSEGRGYTLVNVDTDSFSYTTGKAPDSKESFQNEIDQLNTIYPELINWVDDGVFEKLLVIKAKNYVMRKHLKWCNPKKDFDKNGKVKVKYKGSSIKDQKKEPALREFLDRVIDHFLNEDSIEDIENTYISYCKEALDIKDISRWATKKTITKSVLNPKRTNEQKVLDAIKGEPAQEGDKIWLYTAVDPKGEEGSNILKLTKNYNNDADGWHYVKRVHSTLNILKNLIDMKQFIKYHNKTKRDLLLPLLVKEESYGQTKTKSTNNGYKLSQESFEMRG